MISYRTINMDGLGIFYREAGPPEAPTIVLLHGFPSSSHMYRDLIRALADDFHLVAPDYPGFGNSDSPAVGQFCYTFDHLADVMEQFVQALGLDRFSLYVQDYGAPVGFRLATRHPDWIQAIITQNGNAYDEGLTDFWDPLRAYWGERSEATERPLRSFLQREATVWQYTAGARNPEHISPDAWNMDQAGLDRPGNAALQLELFYDYRSNPPLYLHWHAYFRQYQPPTLVVWGKNDPIFGAAGATAFRRDLKNVEIHLLDTGHFALEEEGDLIAAHIRRFLPAHLT